MRRAILAVAGTVAGLVLLLSFKTTGTAARSTSAARMPPIVAKATRPTKKTPKTPKTATAVTVTGGVSENQYGPVQVRVTVRNGTLVAVTATQYPNGDSRSAQISAYAIPALNQEALQAGSARINMISGASYTSDSYLASLQSALSKAGLA